LTVRYLFKSGRKSRIKSLKKYPKEFFYGFNHLLESGVDAEIIEEEDLGINKDISDLLVFINKILNLIVDFPLIHFVRLIRKENLILLNSSELIVATTNSFGLALGLLKRFNLIKKPILFLAMGILPLRASITKVMFYRFILKKLNIFCLSINEQKYLSKKLINKKVSYLPFGVDIKFWKPSKVKIKKDYILAIGNDNARDWNVLLNAWEKDFPELKIVTSIPIKTNKKNITIHKGNWGKGFLSDQEIKDLYLYSLFVVIPLKQSIQPSGQSCCLQAMACGKPVIMSRIMGLWDETLLKNKQEIIFVEPNSVNNLKNEVSDLLNNTKLYKKLSRRGVDLVTTIYNSESMSKFLLSSIMKNTNIKTLKNIH